MPEKQLLHNTYLVDKVRLKTFFSLTRRSKKGGAFFFFLGSGGSGEKYTHTCRATLFFALRRKLCAACAHRNLRRAAAPNLQHAVLAPVALNRNQLFVLNSDPNIKMLRLFVAPAQQHHNLQLGATAVL